MLAEPRTLRTIMVALGILMIANAFFLYQKYQSISACQSQHAQLDALQARIDGTKR